MPSGWQPDVVPNQPILSSWGNTIRDRTLAVFDTPAQRDAQILAPTEGMHCYIVSTRSVWYYVGAAWINGGARRGIVASGTQVGTPALNQLLNLSVVHEGPASWLAGNTITIPADAGGLYMIQLSFSFRSDNVVSIGAAIRNSAGVDYNPVMSINFSHSVSTVSVMAHGSWLRTCAAGDTFQVPNAGNPPASPGFSQVARLSLLRIADSLAAA